VDDRLLVALVAALPIAGPFRPDPLPETVLKGVVGQQVSVTLPARPGQAWEVVLTPGRRVHGWPYRMRIGDEGPEIWTFPLVQPGSNEIAFRLHEDSVRGGPLPEKRVLIQALTPFEAQQLAPGTLHGTTLVTP